MQADDNEDEVLMWIAVGVTVLLDFTVAGIYSIFVPHPLGFRVGVYCQIIVSIILLFSMLTRFTLSSCGSEGNSFSHKEKHDFGMALFFVPLVAVLAVIVFGIGSALLG